MSGVSAASFVHCTAMQSVDDLVFPSCVSSLALPTILGGRVLVLVPQVESISAAVIDETCIGRRDICSCFSLTHPLSRGAMNHESGLGATHGYQPQLGEIYEYHSPSRFWLWGIHSIHISTEITEFTHQVLEGIV